MEVADRAPDALAAGTPEPLRSQLIEGLGQGQVLTRALDLVRYASDASPYRLIPQAVIMARDAADVASTFALGRRLGVSVNGRDDLRGALDEAIGANEPRLVEVAVEPGMSLY